MKRLSTIFLILFFLVFFIAPMATALTIDLTGTIRDFHASHPDFEGAIAAETGIVQSTIGSDGKPVYAKGDGSSSATTSGQANFDQWYRDVSGVNMSTFNTITLDNTITTDPNVFTYSSNAFFPIDNQLFGNTPGYSHNYHFTYEIHTQFTYQGGETFSFTGDDDLWVFINDTLAIDLGGVHGPLSQSVALNSFGLTIGNIYDFDLFFAERHTTGSNFRIDTSIALQSNLVPEPTTMLLLGSGLIGLAGFRRKLKNRRQ